MGGTPARSGKVARIAERLRTVAPGEVALAVAYLSGDLRQRRTGLGYAALRDPPEPAAAAPTLTIAEVDGALERIAAAAGSGSGASRRRLLLDLLERCTAPEQRLLTGLIAGEVRQGALAGVMVDAVAHAAGLPPAEVRRAAMLRGSLPAVAEVALTSGAVGLSEIGLRVGRPVQPMLASPSDGIVAALDRAAGNPVAVEWKLDGVRLQVHRDGDDVSVYTRTLDDVTGRLPEVVAAVRALPVRSIVLDGEAIALGPDGRPLPFQVTASRAGSSRDPDGGSARVPLTAFFFDVLHLDGADLLDAPAAERAAVLARVVPAGLRAPRLVTDSVDEAAAFLQTALDRGHEGVVVKSLAAPYEAGRRGAAWLKVKPRHTLDLVVLAAEWGHGRRRGWLSNLHLAARDAAAPGGTGWVMLGKTFKGLTDAMLAEQTERLLALETSRTGWAVQVRPEFVVEVAFDGVQTSPRYPGGVALRFARVLRLRPDKPAAQADTIDTVRGIHAGARPVDPIDT